MAILPDGGRVPVAATWRSRLLGLALLRPGAADGLLIPGCRSVHTIGMRFPLDLHFLDADGTTVSRQCAVPPGRFVREPGARSVLELATVPEDVR